MVLKELNITDPTFTKYKKKKKKKKTLKEFKTRLNSTN